MIQEIIDLQQNLSEKRYVYCADHIKGSEKVVYFAYGLLTREYVFSTYNIWYALNQFSKNYKCILGGIGNGDYPIDEENIIIPSEYQLCEEKGLIDNLYYIVIPFVSYDISEIVERLRKNNKGVKIAYQIDFDFTNIAEKLPEFAHYEQNQDVIINNIRCCNKFICSSETLYNEISNKIGTKLKGSGVYGTHNIPFVNESILEEVEGDVRQRKPEEPFRIGVITTKYNGSDLMYFKKVWKTINDKLGKEKVNFVLYGDSNKEMNKAFSGIDFEFTQQTGIRSYYNELFNLKLDCVVIPTEDTKWNRVHYDIERVLELQALGIPVLVANIKPINRLIKDEVNGFLCEDRDRFIRQLEVLSAVDNSDEDADSISKRVSRLALNHVIESFNINTDENIKKIEELFIN